LVRLDKEKKSIMQQQELSTATLRLAFFWYMAGAAMLMVVAITSLAPVPDIGVSDKFAHFVTYAMLSGWFSLLVIRRASLGWVVVGLIAYGIAIEGLQGMTDYRLPEWGDVVANSTGVLLGTLVFFTPLYRLMRALDLALAGVLKR